MNTSASLLMSGATQPPGAVGHPDDSKRVQAIWDRAMSSGSAFEIEVRMRKGDGNYRWFLARYNPVLDDEGQVLRWYVACIDIDDLKRDERRSQTFSRRRTILSSSAFGCVRANRAPFATPLTLLLRAVVLGSSAYTQLHLRARNEPRPLMFS
jgi:PAS domain-containing protein